MLCTDCYNDALFANRTIAEFVDDGDAREGVFC
jgi:hypothetical protein